MAMKILIADDHAVLREGLKQILAEEYPAAEFRETGTTQETLDCLQQGEWDVLLLDVFLPGRSGLEVLQETRTVHPNLPVLVLSSAPEEQLAIRVLRAGASGYLNKQTAPERLVEAVRKVLAGGRYLSTTIADRLATELTRAGQLPHETLSDREFQVMHMVVAGKSLKEIANELSLSVKTISTFHTRIWEKVGVKNDVELVHYAIEHGFSPQAAAREPQRPGESDLNARV
jgi:DNA-binding NarL/FixJ family response regulator